MSKNLTSQPSAAALARVKTMCNQELRSVILSHVPEIEEPSEWHTPTDLAPLMGVNRQALYEQLRDLYPAHQGEWRLGRAEVERLVRRVVQAGKKVRVAVALLLTEHEAKSGIAN